MKTTESLFTTNEREQHEMKEKAFIQEAKLGNRNTLYNFWIKKRELFLQRAFDRMVGA